MQDTIEEFETPFIVCKGDMLVWKGDRTPITRKSFVRFKHQADALRDTYLRSQLTKARQQHGN